jgi:membrane fusion protein (multidrug efflux system)
MAAAEVVKQTLATAEANEGKTGEPGVQSTSFVKPAAPILKPSVRRGAVALIRVAVILVAICCAVVVPMGWGEWVASRTDQRTDDAYLKADTSPISSQVSGQVKAVLVGDFQPVRAGDELVQIDDSDYAAQLARAQAAIGSAEATIRNADSQIVLQQKIIAQSEAVVGEVVADRDRAKSEYDRQQAASSEGWTTAQKRENAVADLRRFEAQLVEKQADVDAQRHRIDVLQTQKQQAEADLASRKADLDIARINLARTHIMSPVDGIASASRVRIGQFVSAGTRVIDVVPLPHLYVLANYKETQLSRIRSGQAATLTIDAFPGHVLTGHVVDLSPASGSEFALLPPDNATGNFTKVAQRIAVRIEIDDADGLADLLRPGMSVVPTIHTDPKASRQSN